MDCMVSLTIVALNTPDIYCITAMNFYLLCVCELSDISQVFNDVSTSARFLF